MFLSLVELSFVLILVDILECPSSLRNIILKLADINAAVHELQFSFAISSTFYEIS